MLTRTVGDRSCIRRSTSVTSSVRVGSPADRGKRNRIARDPENEDSSEHEAFSSLSSTKRRRRTGDVVNLMPVPRRDETSIRAAIDRLQMSHDAMVASFLQHSNEMEETIGSLRIQVALMRGRGKSRRRGH